MRFQRLPLMIALILIALLLVSCKEDTVATTIVNEAPAPISDSTGDDEAQTGDEVTDTEDDKPEPRTEMSATHPGSVKLGSGRVTLVEFFAFW